MVISCVPSSYGQLAAALQKMPDRQELNIPTYDGSGQAVHPDILYSNRTFYLAATPCPYSNNQFENPSLYTSMDGIHFEAPTGVVNPLVPTPEKGYNYDPDLYQDPRTGTFFLLYMDCHPPTSENMNCLTWTGQGPILKKNLLEFDFNVNEAHPVSPSLIHSSAGEYYLFYVNIADPSVNYRIEYMQSRDLLTWDKTNRHPVTMNFPDHFKPWHLDVFYSGKYRKYYMICTGFFFEPRKYMLDLEPKYRRYANLLASSTDLIHWKFIDFILNPDDLGIQRDIQFVYRSSGITAGSFMAIYYSFRDTQGKWGIGIRKYTLDEQGNLDKTLYQPPGGPELDSLLAMASIQKAHADSLAGRTIRQGSPHRPVNPTQRAPNAAGQFPKQVRFVSDSALWYLADRYFSTFSPEESSIGLRGDQLDICLMNSVLYDDSGTGLSERSHQAFGIISRLLQDFPGNRLLVIEHFPTGFSQPEESDGNQANSHDRITAILKVFIDTLDVDPLQITGTSRSDSESGDVGSELPGGLSLGYTEFILFSGNNTGSRSDN